MLNELIDDIHENAIEHGWWDEGCSFGEIIALCHSELSEALEEYRDGKAYAYWFNSGSKAYSTRFDHEYYNGEKPEGIAIELADCIIRILDYCGQAGIDMDKAIRIKHEYNKTRPYKHGGKAI